MYRIVFSLAVALFLLSGGIVDLARADEASLAAHMKRIAAAGESEDAVRAAAAKAILAAGDRPLVAKMLNSDDPNDRFGAADLYRDIPDWTATERKRLLELMGDEKFSTRGGPVWFAAAMAVGHSRPLPIETLRKQMNSENWILRRASLIAANMAEKDSASLLDDAVKRFRDEKIEIVRIAVGYLIVLEEKAVPAMDEVIKMLDHEDFHTQYWAARALGAMGDHATPAVPDLIRKLNEGVSSVRRNAALALGQIGLAGGRPAVEALIKALNNPRVVVVEAAAKALQSFPKYKPLIAEPLAKKLKHPAAEVKLATAETLLALDLHVDDSLYQLNKVLQGRDYPWRAAEILGRNGKRAQEAAPLLIEALQAVDPETRVAAATALAQIGAKDAVESLKKAAESDPEAWVRESAAAALTKLQ